MFDSVEPCLWRLLSVFRDHTVVMQEGECVTESHADFHIGGTNEHVLFIQHKLGLARHNALPSLGIGKRRVLRAPKQKAAGRPKDRTRGAKREGPATAKKSRVDAQASANNTMPPASGAEGAVARCLPGNSPQNPLFSASYGLPSSYGDGWMPTSAGEARSLPLPRLRAPAARPLPLPRRLMPWATRCPASLQGSMQRCWRRLRRVLCLSPAFRGHLFKVDAQHNSNKTYVACSSAFALPGHFF